MAGSLYPRLSQAKDLLPKIRAHLIDAASRHSLPAGFSLDLVPIVEDGLVGYEFLPNWATWTYLTIGCDERCEPVLRVSTYRAEAPSVLRVASVDGRAAPAGRARRRASPPAARLRPVRLAVGCRSGMDRARGAVSGGAAAMHRGPRLSVRVPRRGAGDRLRAPGRLRSLDRFLRRARRSALRFCVEARRWRTRAADIPKAGHVGVVVAIRGERPARGMGNGAARHRCRRRVGLRGRGAAPCDRCRAAPIFPAASTRRPRKHRVAERRRGDRRHADRPPPDGRLDERRQGDRRQRDRRRTMQGGSAG